MRVRLWVFATLLLGALAWKPVEVPVLSAGVALLLLLGTFLRARLFCIRSSSARAVLWSFRWHSQQELCRQVARCFSLPEDQIAGFLECTASGHACLGTFIPSSMFPVLAVDWYLGASYYVVTQHAMELRRQKVNAPSLNSRPVRFETEELRSNRELRACFCAHFATTGYAILKVPKSISDTLPEIRKHFEAYCQLPAKEKWESLLHFGHKGMRYGWHPDPQTGEDAFTVRGMGADVAKEAKLPSSLRKVLDNSFEQHLELASFLHTTLLEGLQVPDPTHYVERPRPLGPSEITDSALKLFRYKETRLNDAAHWHVDSTYLTMIGRANASGLEIVSEKGVLLLEPLLSEDDMVVFGGSELGYITRGFYPALLHRANVFAFKDSRQSTPFFYGPQLPVLPLQETADAVPSPQPSFEGARSLYRLFEANDKSRAAVSLPQRLQLLLSAK